MNILFYDPVTPSVYLPSTLEGGRIGGTEATVLRVAMGLHAKGHNIRFEQRDSTDLSLNDSFFTNTLGDTFSMPNMVVTLRDAGHYIRQKARFPEAKHYLWMHDVCDGRYVEHMEHHLLGQEATIVPVSDWHTSQIRYACPNLGPGVQFKRIYNPLAEYCERDGTPVDPFKLVFFSSPHKGLKQVLEIFDILYLKDNRYRLHIANPGYYADFTGSHPGIVLLGSLPHKQVVDQVRSAVCMFYPQTSFAETFGLVLTESNAVGTPVIAHGIGAAPEVLDDRQILDCNNTLDVVNRVLEYSNGKRIKVKAKPEFKLATVVREWEKLI